MLRGSDHDVVDESDSDTTAPTGSSQKRVRGVLQSLAGLFFLGAGLFVGCLVLNILCEYFRVWKWVEVPARIESVTLERNSGGRGRIRHKVVAHYTYRYGDRSYEGRRVGLSTNGDNVGNWHQEVHHELQQACWRGQPVPCYVNPASPEHALLRRDLRFGLVIFLTVSATVFSTIGLALLWDVQLKRKQRQAEGGLS